MDRFSAYLLLRRTLRLPANRRRAQLAETIAEKLADLLGEPPDLWAMMALLLHLDLEYAAHHQDVRGRVAKEQAELEGLASELAFSLERSWSCGEKASALEHGIQLAAWLAERASVGDLKKELELGRSCGDDRGDRLDAALEGLGLGAQRAAAVAQEAIATLNGARP